MAEEEAEPSPFLWEMDGLPTVPPACKRRRLERKARALGKRKLELVEEEVSPSRPRRRSAVSAAHLLQEMQMAEFEASVLAEQPERSSQASREQRGRSRPGLARKPQLGRVKKCSTKAVELLDLGQLNPGHGWFNNGYIFPMDFRSRTQFRSSANLGENCWHNCSILGETGVYWPLPTFHIVAEDNAEPVVAKSATGAWTGILNRIKAAIIARRKAGDDIPPPSGTAIPGPEFFGLTNATIVGKIEGLDPEHKCVEYWQGKADRLAYLLAYGNKPEKKVCAIPRQAGGIARPSGLGHTELDIQDLSSTDSENEEAQINRWSSLSRAERLQKRRGSEDLEDGEEEGLLPGVIDPITLMPIRSPAASPYGHVMGFATWKAVLAEFGRCPFTKEPMHKEQLTVLTSSNIERLRSRLILP